MVFNISQLYNIASLKLSLQSLVKNHSLKLSLQYARETLTKSPLETKDTNILTVLLNLQPFNLRQTFHLRYYLIKQLLRH